MDENDIAARFERVEHFTAAMDEQRRKDREEYKVLWRGTRRHMDEMTLAIERLAEENRQTAASLRKLGEETDRRFEETDRHLRELGAETDRRIRDLTSSIGELIRHIPGQQQ
jgi:hypothetical protein